LKKILIVLIFIVALSNPVFSQFVDSFDFMETSNSYSEFTKAIKDNENPFLCLNLYENLDFSSYNSIEKSIFAIKTKLNYARYLIDNDEKREAETLLKEAEIELQNIKTNEMFYNILDSEAKSLWYLINNFKYLSKAIKATNQTKKNFKAYPNEIAAVLQYANTLLYTPGKNKEDAIEVFKTIENEELMVWDQFSLYSGLGMSYFKLNNQEKALLYLSLATNIYIGDSIVNNTLKELP